MNLSITHAGVHFIATMEDFSPVVYEDQAGKQTIGYGHLVRAGERWDRITQGEALDLMMRDIAREIAQVDAVLRVELQPFEADAVISWAFNVGGHSASRSSLIRLLNIGNTEGAANQFLRWDKITDPKTGKKIVSRGLRRRRERERGLFLLADYGGAW